MKQRKECGHCGAPITPENEEFRPFCSARCRTIDLGRWLSGDYVIPSEKQNIEEESEEDKSESSSF